MKSITRIEFHAGSKEEKLPDFTPEFPYIATRSELDRYTQHFVPWHWHKAVELFYMESGELEYQTPNGKWLFPPGAGGMVNSNILHMTRPQAKKEKNIQALHIFDPSLLAGEQGSRIEQKYIMPVAAASQLEMVALYPGDPAHEAVLEMIQETFLLSEQAFGFEIRLREALSEIWLRLFQLSRAALEKKRPYDAVSDKIKLMMIYIHEHYPEKISIPELAAAAFLSERECFRVFRACLHMTPAEYMQSYRVQMACQMLANGREAVTFIGRACGLGSSSYFGKVFREYMGCTPLAYRQKWRNPDIK